MPISEYRHKATTSNPELASNAISIRSRRALGAGEESERARSAGRRRRSSARNMPRQPTSSGDFAERTRPIAPSAGS